MKLFKRVLFILIGFLFSLNEVFAGFLTDNLGSAFNDFNNLFLKSPATLLFIYFLGILVGTFTIFKASLRFVFKSTNQFHQKEINIISFMLAIIGTSGLFFMFKDKGDIFIVNLFGGTAGLLISIIISILILKTFREWSKIIPDEKKYIKVVINWTGLMLSFGLVYSYLIFWLNKAGFLPNWADSLKFFLSEIFTIIIFVGFFIFFWFLFKSSRPLEIGEGTNEDSEKEGLNKLISLIDNSNKEVSKLDNYFKASSDFLNKKTIRKDDD